MKMSNENRNVNGTLTIYTQRRGAALGDLFGIFFEDLNHAADGGLYAELIRNRSFEFDRCPANGLRGRYLA